MYNIMEHEEADYKRHSFLENLNVLRKVYFRFFKVDNINVMVKFVLFD